MGTAIVVGSINRDIVANVANHPRAGETVLTERGALFPGGKGANQAVAIARLGERVAMVGRIGDDTFGAEMRAFLAAERIDVSGIVTVPGALTGLGLITVDAAGQNVITVISGANQIWPARTSEVLPALQVTGGDYVVCQLEVPMAVVRRSFEQARAGGAQTVLNAAPFQPLPDDVLAMTDTLIVNELELIALAGRHERVDLADVDAVAACVSPLFARGPSCVVVTLGALGAHVQTPAAPPVRIAGHRLAVRDTTGAGDCFVGAFVAGRLKGRDVGASAISANAAAALSVTRDGAAASMPDWAAVARCLATSLHGTSSQITSQAMGRP